MQTSCLLPSYVGPTGSMGDSEITLCRGIGGKTSNLILLPMDPKTLQSSVSNMNKSSIPWGSIESFHPYSYSVSLQIVVPQSQLSSMSSQITLVTCSFFAGLLMFFIVVYDFKNNHVNPGWILSWAVVHLVASRLFLHLLFHHAGLCIGLPHGSQPRLEMAGMSRPDLGKTWNLVVTCHGKPFGVQNPGVT